MAEPEDFTPTPGPGDPGYVGGGVEPPTPGEGGDTGTPGPGGIGGSVDRALAGGILAGFGHPELWSRGLVNYLNTGQTDLDGARGYVETQVAKFAANKPDAGKWAEDVVAFFLLGETGDVPTPDNVVGPITTLYGRAMQLGLAASLISALCDVKVFGCGLDGLKQFAAMVGDLAGFGPMAGHIQAAAVGQGVGKALQYRAARRYRGNLPGVADALDWFAEGAFESGKATEGSPEMPLGVDELLAFGGIPDSWGKVLKHHAYRPLSYRDLRLFVDTEELDDDWLTDQVKHLKVRPANREKVKAGLLRQAGRVFVTRARTDVVNLFVDGYIAEDECRAQLTALFMADDAIDLAVDAAAVELQAKQLRAGVDLVKARWSKGEIDAKELDPELSVYMQDPDARADWIARATVARFHSVWLTTPAEDAKAALPLYRSAFINDLMTADEYELLLTDTGLADELITLTLQTDSLVRSRTILAAFRVYDLPAGRDEVLHGIITVPQYMARLRADGFPDEYVQPEGQVALALLTRRLEGTIKSQSIPALEAGYVAGLITKASLTALYGEVAYDARTVKDLFVPLDFNRQQKADALAAAAKREKDRLAAAERAAQAKADALAEREAARVQREHDKLIKEQARLAAELAKQLTADAKAAAEAANPGWLSKVRGLYSRVDAAYEANGQTLPSDLWNLAQDVEDEVARGLAADPVAMNILIGKLDARLLALSGASPA